MTLLLITLALLAGTAEDDRDAPGSPVLEGGRERSRILVVVLHGGSWKGTPPLELARRALRELDDDAERLGLRLLAPVAPPSATDPPAGERSAAFDPALPWLTPAGEELVLRVVRDALGKRGRTDARRIHLAGHGAGATAAIHLAARYPDLFAGVAAWSGTPSPVWDAERRVVGLVDDPVPKLKPVGVYLWTATDDPVIDRGALSRFVDGMVRRRANGDGMPWLWEQGEGGHGYGPGPEAGLRFLKDQRRKAAK